MKPAGKFISYWPLAALLVLHIALQWGHVTLDFWNDELYTLEHFVCRDFGAAAADYRSTNNHIFFSLLAQCWARCIGIGSCNEAIVHPVILRMLPLIFSSVAIAITYIFGEKISGRLSGAFAGLLLVTSIPFWNYGAQMRGYGLSMCLCAVVASTAFSALRQPKQLTLLWLILSNLALIYTLPSNIYFTVAIIVCLAVVAPWYGVAARNTRLLVAALICSTFFAALLYVPLLQQMRRLPIFTSGTSSYFLEALRERLPVVTYHFLSARYLLLLPAAGFLVMEKQRRWVWLVASAIILLLPFTLADLRGNSTPYRVFLTGLPLLAVAAGIAMDSIVGRIRAKGWRNAAVATIVFYCLAVFYFQIKKTDAAALRDIEMGRRSGDLYFQYNLHYFHPNADAAMYMRTYARPHIPLVECCRMDAEVLKYISFCGWDRAAAKKLSLDSLMLHCETVDVLVETPDVLRKALASSEESFIGTQQLLQGPRPVQIIRLTVKH